MGFGLGIYDLTAVYISRSALGYKNNRNTVDNQTLWVIHWVPYGRNREWLNSVRRSRGHTFPILRAKETLLLLHRFSRVRLCATP